MKDKIFKVLKFITSRMFFLILGIGLIFGIYMAKAAWNNTVVGGADTLTATRWNDMVAKLIDLDDRVVALEGKRYGGIYVYNNNDTICLIANHFTGGCTCPSGFIATQLLYRATTDDNNNGYTWGDMRNLWVCEL